MGKRRIPTVQASTPRTLHGAIVVARLDLHGLTVDQAERKLEMFLGRVVAQEPGEVVRIVTGKGTGGGGPPQIREMVRDALTGWLAPTIDEWSIDVGAGAYLVRVKGRS
jgi:DNA-nicking Smr family endonuclease